MRSRVRSPRQVVVADEQSATRRLVFRDRLKPDENYLGFLIRLAESNFYNPSWILQEAHFSPYTFSEGCSSSFASNPNVVFSRLADLTGLTVQDLTQLVHPRVDENTVMAFGHSVSRYLLTKRRAKVCPACLTQSNHCRKQWDFEVVTSCPLHGNMLMDKCHECSKPIKWRRRAVSLCACGADWREAELPSLPDSETVVPRMVFQRFGLLPPDRSRSKNNPLYDLPLASSLDGLFLMAGQYHEPVTASVRLILIKKTIQQLHNELLKAFLIFEDWPKNFYIFLDELCRHNKSSNQRSGLRNNFGGVYQALYCRRFALLGAPLSQLLKTEFEKYVWNHWEDGYAKRAKGFMSTGSAGKYVNLLKASHMLHTHPHVIHRLVSEGKLRAVVRKTAQLFLVEASGVKELMKERERFISLEEASRFLGISQLNILSLVDKSLLEGAQAPSADNHYTWRFERTILLSFLSLILSKTARGGRSGCKKLHSFRVVLNQLSRRLSGAGGGIQTLINDILCRRLIPRAKVAGKVGVSTLFFDRKEVTAYLEKKLGDRAHVGLRVTGRITELGLKSEVVYFLARKGLIKTIVRNNRHGRYRVITHKAVSRFKSEFIFAKDAANEVGTSTKFLVSGLQKLGITAVSGRAIDLGPAYIFKRADLEHINLKKLIESLPKKLLLKNPRIITSAEAAKILSVPQGTISELVRNGVVKPHQSASNSKSPVFYRVTVERCKRQFTNLNELISTKAAASVLGVTRNTLFHLWIRRGYLKFEMSRDGHQRLLKKSEVEHLAAFLKDVVNMKEAAALLNVPYEYIRTWTERKWLTPLPNPYPRAFMSHIYSRTALANLRVNHQPVGIHKKTLLPVGAKS